VSTRADEPPTLFWEQHTCLPLSTEATVSDILRYRRPGGAYVCVNVGYAPHTKQMSLGYLDRFRRQIGEHPDLALAGGVADIDAARDAGRIVVAFDLEDSRPLDGDLDMVATFYELGVRALLPTYNTANAAGCGCLDTQDTGLTAYGRDLVRRMNEVGMLVDGSHCSTRTGLDLSEFSTQPMIYSHSAMKGVWDHARNITDEQARDCAATGGVIGIPDVGIGSDFSFDDEDLLVDLEANPDLFPEEYTRWGMIEFIEPETTVGVEAELIKRGYPAEAVAGILGGNFRRVAGHVWK
jgi:membrane dipeptidase